MKYAFPKIHYYNQDFVDIYNNSVLWIQDQWTKGNRKNKFKGPCFHYKEKEKENDELNLFQSCLSTFFLVYSSSGTAASLLDQFYAKQEDNGAIRERYSFEDGKFRPSSSKNPQGCSPPLLSWVELNLFHRGGQKKRIDDVFKKLEKYYLWLEKNFRDDSGLYTVPLTATSLPSSARAKAFYPVDFNLQQCLNARCMAQMAESLNDKTLNFKYNKRYFILKNLILSSMYNKEDGFFYDLDKNKKQLPLKSLAAYWALLANILTEEQAQKLISYLHLPQFFGSENPFPSLALNEKSFTETKQAYSGAVYPHLAFMVIKGLECYDLYAMAREFSLRHLYNMIDSFYPDDKKPGSLWEAYKSAESGKAEIKGNRELFLSYAALPAVTLMIENIIGININLHRKTVKWIAPTLELLGIEKLSLKRNLINIMNCKSNRGWEIRLESEKLYYFTIHIRDDIQRTMPIPSGKCSILIDKL